MICSIPETFRICTRCDSDMADTHVRPFYKFWLEIEDEEGTREQIAGALPSVSCPALFSSFEYVSDL